MSYPLVSAKVSQSRTGQGVRIFELAPCFGGEWQSKLIGWQCQQARELAHKVGPRQALGRNRDGCLAAFWLSHEAALERIEVEFECPASQCGSHRILIPANGNPPVRFDLPKPTTASQV